MNKYLQTEILYLLFILMLSITNFLMLVHKANSLFVEIFELSEDFK